MSDPLRNGATRPRVLGGLALILAVLAVGLPLLGISGLSGAEASLEDALTARSDVDLVLLAAVDAESGARGYAITGRREFLEPFERGRREFERVLQELEAHDGGSQEVGDAAERMREAFARWLIVGDEVVTLTGTGRQEDAAALVRTGRGKAAFDVLRTEHASFAGLLGERVTERQEALDRARWQAYLLVTLGAVSAVGLGSVVVSLAMGYQRTSRALGVTAAESTRRQEMLRTASHELRNPLTGLVLAAEILEMEANEEGNENLAGLASEITKGARRTVQIVADLLDYSRIESGQVVFEMEEVAPGDVVAGAIADVHVGRPGARFDVVTEIPEALRVHGDAARLRMAVRNLLENAIRYGEPPYRVRVAANGNGLAIHVEDAGQGVPEGERETIFGQFERGSTAGSMEGMGIGLYLSREIARRHDGHLAVGQSALGGADFVLELPA